MLTLYIHQDVPCASPSSNKCAPNPSVLIPSAPPSFSKSNPKQGSPSLIPKPYSFPASPYPAKNGMIDETTDPYLLVHSTEF